MDARDYRKIQKVLRDDLAEGGRGALVDYMANGDASATSRMEHLIRTCSHFRVKYSREEFERKFREAICLVEKGQHNIPPSYTEDYSKGEFQRSSSEGFIDFFLKVAILVDEDKA